MNVAIPTLIDPRLALLARASAWHDLVERDEMDIDTAWHELVDCVVTLVPVFKECDMCGRRPCRSESFCAACRKAEEAQRNKPKPQKPPRRVPVCTIEAVKFSVRQRGTAALSEPDNLRRLRMFDPQSLAEFDTWLQEKGYSRC